MGIFFETSLLVLILWVRRHTAARLVEVWQPTYYKKPRILSLYFWNIIKAKPIFVSAWDESQAIWQLRLIKMNLFAFKITSIKWTTCFQVYIPRSVVSTSESRSMWPLSITIDSRCACHFPQETSLCAIGHIRAIKTIRALKYPSSPSFFSAYGRTLGINLAVQRPLRSAFHLTCQPAKLHSSVAITVRPASNLLRWIACRSCAKMEWNGTAINRIAGLDTGQYTEAARNAPTW